MADSAPQLPPPKNRTLLWVILLAFVIVIPRSILITRAHSEYWDDQYHLLRGIAMLDRRIAGLPLNDPPTGEWIEALPLWFMGVHPHSTSDFGGDHRIQLANILYGRTYDVDVLRMVLAIWKSLLFLPIVVVIFIWARDLYSAAAAWLAIAIVLIEPNIAAHISTGALDVLGMEGIVLTIFAADRYLRNRSVAKLILLGVSCGLAMALKNTALIAPAVVAIILLVGESKKKRTFVHIAGFLLVTFISIWLFTLCDFSRPVDNLDPKLIDIYAATWTHHALPAGVYIASVANGIAHAHRGQPAFLFGLHSGIGWWYYYPAICIYKVPIPIFILAAAAIITIPFVRRRRFEWIVLFSAACWTIMLMASHINIGFRHFLPAYIFWIVLIARILARNSVTKVTLPLAVVCLLGLVLDDARIHPDYLSYINFPRSHKYWWDISDSNIDWGQNMKQVREWLVEHPQGNRPIYLRRFTDPYGLAVRRYLGFGVKILTRYDPPPHHGLLLISMVREGGVYEENEPYNFLKDVRPEAIIGHSMLVYDLDKIFSGRSADTKPTSSRWGRNGETAPDTDSARAVSTASHGIAM